MEQRIYVISDLVALLRLSRSTIGRRIAAAREGKCEFPLPISAPGQRLLWNARTVEQWLSDNTKPPTPVNANVPIAKSAKQQSRDFAERQLRAQQTLERHRLNRTRKGGTK